MGQASDKHCRLTQQGIRKLEDALRESFGDRPSDNKVAESFSIDRGTVGKIRNPREGVNRSSIDRLFTALDVDLLGMDYETIASPTQQDRSKDYPPNPFGQLALWGKDELLRRIFERLRKGGSQAIIGPSGSGKTEIRKMIARQSTERLQCPTFSLDMRLVRDESSFLDRVCDFLELEAVDPPHRAYRQIEREITKRRKTPHILCLDNIHVLRDQASYRVEMQRWLRGMAEQEYPLQLVVTSKHELQELMPDTPDPSSPFVEFFCGQTERLAYWNLCQVDSLITECLQKTGVIFAPGEIQKIWEESYGKPGQVKELAGELYEAIVARPVI